MIFIDANIFLSYYNEDDVHHNKAIKIFKEIDEGKYGDSLTSDYVFNEVVGVTFRKKGKEKALKLGNKILNTIFMINIDINEIRTAWDFFNKNQLTFNLVDCTNISIMNKLEIKNIATFDKEFKKVKKIKVID